MLINHVYAMHLCNVIMIYGVYLIFLPDDSSALPYGVCVACPMYYDPVCGSDGKTYGNICELNCFGNGALKIKDGLCGKRSPEYDGDDENERVKRNTGTIKPIQNGDCPDACPLMLALVCASDGKTYSNECVMKRDTCSKNPNAAVTVVSRGPCRA